ncbi:MAG: 1,4-alpha-glucan branching protein GlgB [Gammaproteobacteria bacterium]|nr:1,4-alpha-glucan branching protein GlgB [Gammaproteobacteria bacterium]
MASNGLDVEFQKITEARHHDPFAVLGKHRFQHQEAIRAYFPYATEVTVAEGEKPMQPIANTGIFQWSGDIGEVPDHYRLIWRDADHREHISHDPYTFPPQVPDFDLHLFSEGKHWHAYRFLGAHKYEIDGVGGILFVVWAPNAERVSVVGDLNRWDGRCHPMRVRGGTGVWELFIPDLAPGGLYKYEIRNRDSGELLLKSDPYAQQYEIRPNTASIISADAKYVWGDQVWMEKRRHHDWQHAPMSIYEVHLGSWRRGPEGEFLTYQEYADQLISYVLEMGFSYIELLPITEHPYDPSWGYQATGYFAPTSRYGKPDDLRYLVEQCHQNNIGVILDWVPAHFPKDAHGLARFDGSALYEHEDPRLGEHLDWSTLIYNFSRNEVKNFLLSSAMYWVEEFHFDGLRVDAVASMLYLDYSRTDWVPNKHGGRENLDAIEFLQQLNTAIHEVHPGVLMFAEESTSWPQVSRPVYMGGLGFDIKWNMGWMNDTLNYISHQTIHRKYHHDLLTFSMLYAFTENFLLPFSHDEVVHGKQSMLYKMPGDEWQKFANLRLLYTYMFTHPGKKLLFMGTEFAQGKEWDSTQTMDWYVLKYAYHQGVQKLVKDLNKIYHQSSALHRYEFDWQGFEWIDCHDSDQSVMSFVRRADNDFLIVIINFTPLLRENYRIGVPQGGEYVEIFNSDSEYYGGSNVGNGPDLMCTDDLPWMDKLYSLSITLPPLASLILKPKY